MKKNSPIIKFVTSELTKAKALKLPARYLSADYVGSNTSELIFWNLTIPRVREVLPITLAVYKFPTEKLFLEFEKVWFKSKVFEIKTVAIHWLEKLSTDDLVKYSKKIATWANEIDNWAHSDGLCGIYARIYEASPRSLEKIFSQWKRSKNPWLRRCSMVGVLYYSRFRKSHPPFKYAISTVQPHLTANDYYVQKGLGWTLREIYNVYPTETLIFIKKNLHLISPTAWYAATEKLPLKQKKELVNIRKNLRKVAKARTN